MSKSIFVILVEHASLFRVFKCKVVLVLLSGGVLLDISMTADVNNCWSLINDLAQGLIVGCLSLDSDYPILNPFLQEPTESPKFSLSVNSLRECYNLFFFILEDQRVAVEERDV